MDAEARRQAHRDADARDVGQAADDRFLLGAPEALLVTCHGSVVIRPVLGWPRVSRQAPCDAS